MPDWMLRGASLLFGLAGAAYAHECESDVQKIPSESEPDWLENEVVAGFRVWQILFLICAGLATLVIVACCFKRCRIPRTRQEIEANHKRTQICLLFRSYLDRVPVEEVDLVWALQVVKDGMEKRKSKKKRKRLQKSVGDPEGSLTDPKESLDETEEDESEEMKPKTFIEKIKGIFMKKAIIEFSDDESNHMSTNSLDTFSK